MRHSERVQVDLYRCPDAVAPIHVLLLADELRAISAIRSAIESTAAKLACVSTFKEALLLLRNEHFDLVIVDRHLGGWLSPEACKALVAKARPIPVVGLINEECVLDLRDGIEAGLMGVYYRDQLDVYLMRRLGQLTHLPSLGPPPNGALGATA